VSFYLHAPPSHLSFCCPFHETASHFLFIIYANVPCNTHIHPKPWLNFTKTLKSAYIFSKLIFSLTCLRQFIHITVYNYHVIISVMHMSTLWHHAQFIFLSEEISDRQTEICLNTWYSANVSVFVFSPGMQV
jgi:hypothetical protein